MKYSLLFTLALKFTFSLSATETIHLNDLNRSANNQDSGLADLGGSADSRLATSKERGLELIVPPFQLPPASPSPRINGVDVFGVRPGSPFLFTIPATGDRPMTFSAEHLPRGLHLDSKSGHISGVLEAKGEFLLTLHAQNSLGATEKGFRIVCGDQIALTPPMGWNSWNCFAGSVSADNIKSAADAMVKSGLINHGWTYINVDDYWQNNRDSQDPSLRGPFRDKNGFIIPNSRFPDMKGLADYIHKLGLKAGLYSSPGPWTCGGCAGSFQHEKQDAQTYAAWGFDYLKYDWCSYGDLAADRVGDPGGIPLWDGSVTNAAGAIYPYKVMGDFLHEQHRDIVFSLCQYGMANVEQWGGSVFGNSWRTTDDIDDNWGEERHGWQSGGGGAGGGVATIGFNQAKVAPFAKPGNWNDPDMLVIGEIGWGNLHPTHLTPDEQYAHVSLWCLLAAPLLIGCDMTKLDGFTLSLLSNDEVLAVDQDSLGQEATCVVNEGDLRVYEKQLQDGGRAIGFFNLGVRSVQQAFKEFNRLGVAGSQHVRDLWQQKDLPDVDTVSGVLSLAIPAHGVVLYKLTAAK